MIKIVIPIVAATTTALIAGLFFAWSCSVTPGLTRLSNRAYISAMQSMNRAIQNPLFFSCFFGAAILLPLSTFLHYESSVQTVYWLLLAATILYEAGVMGATIFGNVPLNESLEAFDLQASSADEVAAQRARFESPWNRLNHIRTITSAMALVLIIIACVLL